MSISKRILTGDRPTGCLHLGHYFGSLENRVKLQNQGFELFIIIADFQVLTDRLEITKLENNILDLVMDYLSIGINPDKSIIFVQSRIPELSELFIYFSMLVTMTRLKRNPTVKEEVMSSGVGKRLTLGMLSYPISQAADILLFMPDIVPVGEDQLPHLEQTREIARVFNNHFGKVFKIPEPLLGKFPRLIGLDGKQKMSKSRNNAIFLSDSQDVIYRKIRSAITDSGREIIFNPETKPYISNLITLYKTVTGERYDIIERRFKNKSYVDFKNSLAEAINSFLEPIRSKRKEFEQNKTLVVKILREGTEKAQLEAQKNMKEIKTALKMNYQKIF